jgi:hypothetical protein
LADEIFGGALLLSWILFIGYLVVKESLNKNYVPVTLFCSVVGLFGGVAVKDDYPIVGACLAFLGGAIFLFWLITLLVNAIIGLVRSERRSVSVMPPVDAASDFESPHDITPRVPKCRTGDNGKILVMQAIERTLAGSK